MFYGSFPRARKAFAYQRDEPWVQQQLRLLHPHRHDRRPLMGAVVRRQFGAADQRCGLHQAVHVDREHFHGVGQDQLWVGPIETVVPQISRNQRLNWERWGCSPGWLRRGWRSSCGSRPACEPSG